MIKRNQRRLNRLNAFLDAMIVLLSYLFASWLWLDVVNKDIRNMARVQGLRSGALIAALIYAAWTVFLLWAFRLYHTSRTHRAPKQNGRILAVNVVAILTAASGLYLFRMVDFSRGVLAVYFVVSSVLLIAKRTLIQAVLSRARSRGYNLKHVLVIGGGEMARRYTHSVETRPQLGINVDMLLVPDEKLLHELETRLHGAGIDEVILALEPSELPVTLDAIRVCEKCGTRISVIPFYNDVIPTCPTIDTVGNLKLIQLRTMPLDDSLNAFVKRAFDLAVSAFLLLVLSPLLLALALFIRLSSPGPIFFKQERVGLNKKNFVMYKFRSMRVNSTQDTAWSSQTDDRRTKIGAILRKTSLDELPQLLNVLKGDMSLVGPRPEIPFYVEQFRETVPRYMVKHQVRPGMTGWAQVNGFRGDTSIEARIQHDLWYIENWSFTLDMRILLMTAFGGMVNSEKMDDSQEKEKEQKQHTVA